MPVNTGKMPEKIAASAKYHSAVLTELHNNPKNRNAIIESALSVIGNYFGFYMDNLARRDHASFHHVYETGKTGQQSARLFYYTISANTGVPSIQYQFRSATVQEKSGQVYVRKAFIMEAGTPLTIKPRSGKYLVFDVDGEKVFTKSVYIPNPGGEQVQGAFADEFNMFISRQASSMLEDMGFYDKINIELSKESDLALTRINAGNFNGISMGSDSANKIARRSKI